MAGAGAGSGSDSGAGPGSLAQLIARRGRAGRRPETQPTADTVGQFGLLFAEPEASPEPVSFAGNVAGHEAAEAAVEAPEISIERQRKLWSVAELVGVLRGRLEREYADVWVGGEISNCRPAASGHLYFTLKDGEAQLPVVLFRRQAMLLRWKPEDGMAVLARGRVSVFESRGQLQLIAESLEPRGAGALQMQFEQLKARLRAEGLFEQDRKRALPAYPGTIGVVTSTQGAVIRDIVTVCHRRHGCMDILVYPSAVQGAGAAAEIAAGVRYFNRAAAEHGAHRVDVIVVARGGGSAEDLWAFNDEALARVIAASELPVVSAVGHETDFTIADFVADLRAPTPSAAAEILTEAHHRAEERVHALEARLLRGVRFQQMTARQRYSRIAAEGVLRRMRDGIGRRQQRMDDLRERLGRCVTEVERGRRERLRSLGGRLLRQDVSSRLFRARASLARVEDRLQRVGNGMLLPWSGRVGSAELRLRALSPMAVLERGYALAFGADGRLLRSMSQVSSGEEMVTRLADGAVRSVVTEPMSQNREMGHTE